MSFVQILLYNYYDTVYSVTQPESKREIMWFSFSIPQRAANNKKKIIIIPCPIEFFGIKNIIQRDSKIFYFLIVFRLLLRGQ